MKKVNPKQKLVLSKELKALHRKKILVHRGQRSQFLQLKLTLIQGRKTARLELPWEDYVSKKVGKKEIYLPVINPILLTRKEVNSFVKKSGVAYQYEATL